MDQDNRNIFSPRGQLGRYNYLITIWFLLFFNILLIPLKHLTLFSNLSNNFTAAIYFVVYLLSFYLLGVANLKRAKDASFIKKLHIIILILLSFCPFVNLVFIFLLLVFKSERDKFSELQKKFYALLIITFSIPALFLYVQKFHYRFLHISFSSMAPTIIDGDFVLLDVSLNNISDLKRGDIVAFNYPKNPREIYIKRVIAFPGEKVKVSGSEILIDEKPIAQKPLDEKTIGLFDLNKNIKKYSYDAYIYDYGKVKAAGMYNRSYPLNNYDTSLRVSTDSVFVVGDNRSSSFDSRSWGALDKKYIIGKVTYILYSFSFKEKLFRYWRTGKLLK